MTRSTPRLLALMAVAAMAVAACGGSDDAGDESDSVETASGSAASDAETADDEDTSSGDGGSSEASEAGFGDFLSGTITLGGAEDSTYSIDDPTYAFVGAGGCSDSNFGISINGREADTGFTAFQINAGIDADLSGGDTGTFDVEEMTLLVTTDGDIAASRTYSGPGTMSITEHDTGGASMDLNARRMAITLDGTLEATGPDGEGEADVTADVLWVMGCP